MELRAGEGHRPQRGCEDPVPAPGAQPRDIPRKIGVKKSRPQIPLRRLNTKSSKTMVSELAVGFLKIMSEALKKLLARVKSPAACRGGGGPQCRNAQGFLHFRPLRRNFCAPLLGLGTASPPVLPNESQAAPWATF